MPIAIKAPAKNPAHNISGILRVFYREEVMK
jgi:hypothetical protein